LSLGRKTEETSKKKTFERGLTSKVVREVHVALLLCDALSAKRTNWRSKSCGIR
jgi:hypothetical protein